MKIALLGSRGVPARYSGFETFYEQLGRRLAARGHAVTVYNRSHFIRDVRGGYAGMRLVSLPSIPTKHLDTISHTLLSSLHALFARYDIVYTCIVGTSPLGWIPRLSGAKTLLNVDGEDWARGKWGRFAGWYQRRCEAIAARTAQVIIADARVIRERYRQAYGAASIYVPYGAGVERDEGLQALERFGLKPREYVLFVGRLVPENAAELLIRAFARVRTDKRLVIVGDAPYAEDYKRRLRAMAGERVLFTGYAFGSDYAQLSTHAYLYVQPSGIEGTRPALLDQLGFGNAVLVRGTRANSDVAEGYGFRFDPVRLEDSLGEELQRLVDDPEAVAAARARARQRIDTYYNWDWIAEFYEDLFARMLRGEPAGDYDAFLARTGRGPVAGAGEGGACESRPSP